MWIMISIWMAGLLYLMFLYRLPGGRKRLLTDFFHMYRDATQWSGSITTNQALRQVAFNILLFLPFGGVVYSLSRKVWLTVTIGLGLSVVMEALQYWTGLGWADVDDVISNTIGLIVGALLIKITYFMIKSKNGEHI